MLGYFLATFIGLSLGLLGGGGSILTVPILVYVLHMEPKQSIALSLAIVGVTSLFGAFSHYKNNNVDFKIAAIFSPMAMIGTFLGAKLSQFLSGQAQLLLFAVVMILASFFMLRGRKSVEEKDNSDIKKFNYFLIVLEGLILGIVTGLVGVGGGFLIVPALLLLCGISMKKSVGTSLLIISLNSFSGFSGYIGLVDIPWAFLLKFTFSSVIGIFIGSNLVQFISQTALKKIFAVFLIVMGVFIFYKNKDTFVTIRNTAVFQTKVYT